MCWRFHAFFYFLYQTKIPVKRLVASRADCDLLRRYGPRAKGATVAP